MLNGKIEKDFKPEYEKIKKALFEVWNNSKGVYSLVDFELTTGQSETAFYWNSFRRTNIKIGDGVGRRGDIILTGTALEDAKLVTAFKSIWLTYVTERS